MRLRFWWGEHKENETMCANCQDIVFTGLLRDQIETGICGLPRHYLILSAEPPCDWEEQLKEICETRLKLDGDRVGICGDCICVDCSADELPKNIAKVKKALDHLNPPGKAACLKDQDGGDHNRRRGDMW